MWINILQVLGGVALLYLGGEALVKNASLLGRIVGLRPLTIGLTIVAFGTSAPELATCWVAALGGANDLALGNVVGSNIANIALILGICAVIQPLATQARFLKREVPIMILAAALTCMFALDGVISAVEGIALLALMAPYMWMLLRVGGEEPAVIQEYEAEFQGTTVPALWRTIVGVVVGIGVLTLGASILVAGGTGVARAAGVPEWLIGVTLVAVGTSLPELASSVVAALKNEADIALGNIVGSNIFNIFVILASTALLHPVGVPASALRLDLWVMLGLSLLLLPILMTGLRMGRREGAVMLAAYAGYLGFLATTIQ